MPIEQPEFVGDGERHCKEALDGAWNRTEHYRADTKLANAVNLALRLKRPLLLEGDPGCGKTRLAYAAAWELGWPLYRCYVRSTHRCEDLLYEFDQLNRLYDIQAACNLMGRFSQPQQLQDKNGHEDETPTPFVELKPKSDYVSLQPLGQAVSDAKELDRPSVVLIDEIDKAGIDFPNDLLQVLDEWRFEIKEVEKEEREIDALKGLTVQERRHALPLVIVTSNREKPLPGAFLRRCLYFFIKFPETDKLKEIVEAHFGEPPSPFFKTALNKFMDLRAAIKWIKEPGTSECLDWVRLLDHAEKLGDMTKEKLEKAALHKLEFGEALVKNHTDLENLNKRGGKD